MEEKWLPTGSSNGHPRQTRSFLESCLQDESWSMPETSGALQVGYLPRGYPADKGRKERTRKRMKERHLVSHPSRHEGFFFSSSPAALDTLLLPGSYSGKRDTDPVARKLPTGARLNQNDGIFFPETLRV